MKTLLAAFLLIMTIACNNKKQAVVKTASAGKIVSTAVKNPETRYGVEGFYTGVFAAKEYDDSKDYTHYNKITICIDSLDAEKIYGHSVVAGNERPFSGRYNKDGGNYTASLKEPGDNKYDGVFTLSIFPGNKKIIGTWIADDKALPVTVREYDLHKQVYKYDPSLELPEEFDGIFIPKTYDEKTEKGEAVTSDALKFNASQKLLTSGDIENMFKADLEVMRNAIYARHGYSFKNIRMRELFDSYVDWYMPVSTNVSASLTETELKNIELIKRYEAHATKYYDAYGR